ncbi:MAG: hypothetical protein LBR33_03635 [Propionibacteriaceae bacterium]|jgi:hypothetical protein|nr:hypothetical protein [Propionibacteriaceae bacterium]
MSAQLPRLLRFSRRVGAVLLAAALASGVTGCSKEDNGLPSVGGATSTANADKDLEKIAQAFYTCMKDEGFPVEYSPGPDGRSTMVTFSKSVPVIWMNGEGSFMYTEAVPQADIDALYAEFDQYYADLASSEAVPAETVDPAAEPAVDYGPFGQVKLLVDGVDQTEAYQKCLDSSGYSETAVYDDYDYSPMMDAYNELAVEASNEWAKCARDNGYPDIKDTAMPTDEDHYPTVVLPVTITEEQLRALLEVCPAFDPAVEEANNQIYEGLDESQIYAGIPEGVKGQPSIGFDFPGYNGDYNSWPENPTEEQVATMDRIAQLQSILYEAQQAYYEQNYGDEGTVVSGGGGVVISSDGG